MREVPGPSIARASWLVGSAFESTESSKQADASRLRYMGPDLQAVRVAAGLALTTRDERDRKREGLRERAAPLRITGLSDALPAGGGAALSLSVTS
jgi:hypothetical protein